MFLFLLYIKLFLFFRLALFPLTQSFLGRCHNLLHWFLALLLLAICRLFDIFVAFVSLIGHHQLLFHIIMSRLWFYSSKTWSWRQTQVHTHNMILASFLIHFVLMDLLSLSRTSRLILTHCFLSSTIPTIMIVILGVALAAREVASITWVIGTFQRIIFQLMSIGNVDLIYIYTNVGRLLNHIIGLLLIVSTIIGE